MHITTLDWIFLVGYLLFCAGIGIIVGLRVKDTDHYLLSRQAPFREVVDDGSEFRYRHSCRDAGVSGWSRLQRRCFWYFVSMEESVCHAVLLDHGSGVSSHAPDHLAEVMEDRYGAWMGGIYTIFALCYFTVNTANMLKGEPGCP